MRVNIVVDTVKLVAEGDYYPAQRQTMEDPAYDALFEVTHIYAPDSKVALDGLLLHHWDEIQQLALEAYEDAEAGAAAEHLEAERRERREA